MTVTEALRLPLEQRLNKFGTKQLTSIKLDTETYSGYKGYSFFYELTLVKQPERTQGGVIDLSSHAYFITPHLKIDFSLISYEDFIRLRQQQLSKLTFNLTCWDTDNNCLLENEEVYFYPDSLPKFALMSRKLNGEKWTEIIGAQNYTIELVGTNRTQGTNSVIYHLNKPNGIIWHGDIEKTKDYPKRSTVGIGNSAIIFNGKLDDKGEEILQKISDITFEDEYQFLKWSTTSDGKGFGYIDGDEYYLKENLELYAIWKKRV